MNRSFAGFFFLLCLCFVASGCRHEQQREGGGPVTIIFKHEKFFAQPELFERLLKKFEQENPGIRVRDETLTAASDETHQFYVINLEAKSSDFDVLSLDVIWVPEFARAGWLYDLSNILPPEKRSDFFNGPMQAVTYENKVYAIPWYIDAGILYYRKDLLQKYGFAPPRYWDELVKIASEIRRREPGMYGFLWQGKQYEGLVCNMMEFIWGNGGEILEENKVVVDSSQNQEAVRFARDLIHRYRVSPPFVTTAIEDTSRQSFGNGKAIFLRNWPYAWNLFEQPGSSLRGKVGILPLPSFRGHSSASTLGGWQVAVNRYSRHPREAAKLVQYLTSPEVQRQMSIHVGYKPTLKALYKDPEVMRQQPFIASLYPIMENARPRPATPYYMMISQVLQPEFSAVLSQIKEPEEALDSANRQIAFILRTENPQIAILNTFVGAGL